MDEYCLMPDEILYLAATVGAETFYGVEDTLSGLSEGELKHRVAEIETSLSDKGYLESDFDGNKTCLPQLLQMVRFCGRCERFLSVDREQPGEAQQGWIYFLTGQEAVRMERRNEQYYFSERNFGEIKKETLDAVAFKETDKKTEDHFTVRLKDLDKARTLAGRGSVDKGIELLMKAGAKEGTARTLVGSAAENVAFFSLLFMDIRNETEPGYSVIGLQGEELLSLEYETVENEDYVLVQTTYSGEMTEKIETGFVKIGGTNETVDFV